MFIHSSITILNRKFTLFAATILLVSLCDTQQLTAAADDMRHVVATGAGLSPDAAKRNALANAVESVVGTLVLATTLVENDEIVTDKVIKYSMGEVKAARVIRAWQEDNLHFVKIRAAIQLDKIRKQLAAHNIATIEVDGAGTALVIDAEVDRMEAAQKLFAESIQQYSPTKVIDTKLLGQPDIKPNGELNYDVTTTIRLESDPQKWEAVRRQFSSLLSKLGAKRVGVDQRQLEERGGWGTGNRLLSSQVKGTNFALCQSFDMKPIPRDPERRGSTATWVVYELPFEVANAMNKLQSRTYKVKVEFLDAAGDSIWDVEEPLGINSSRFDPAYAASHWNLGSNGSISQLGPHLLWREYILFPVWDVEVKTTMLKSILKDVKSIRAELHEIKPNDQEK